MTRKPRKMPKNQRAYPKKGKPRLVEVTDETELEALYDIPDDLGRPHIVRANGRHYINASELRKWRALRNPPTSSVEQV